MLQTNELAETVPEIEKPGARLRPNKQHEVTPNRKLASWLLWPHNSGLKCFHVPSQLETNVLAGSGLAAAIPKCSIIAPTLTEFSRSATYIRNIPVAKTGSTRGPGPRQPV